MLILGGAEHYMDPAVLSYIRENCLYGTGRNYKNLPVEELRDVVVSLLKPKRVNHVLGCAETAVRLAEKYGADPMLARRAVCSTTLPRPWTAPTSCYCWTNMI